MIERISTQVSPDDTLRAAADIAPCDSAIKTLAVIGVGAWGSALAAIAERSEHKIRMWSRRSPENLADVIAGADIVLSAVSMKGVPSVAEQVRQIGLTEGTIIVTATKGLDPKTLRTPSKIWQDAFPDHPVVVLSGPNLSKEIVQKLPAATVVASTDIPAAESVQEFFSTDTFRVYVNTDPIGTELGGTLKNVMAIASGVCDGMKLGTNAKAALLTRALPEMIRVGTTLGASAETFFGLSGLGDLLATCDSPLSRNYQVGFGLARGKTLVEILDQLEGTAEGVNTARVLVRLANQHEIPIPISRQVSRLLKGVTTPQEAVQALMERDLKPEFCDLFEDDDS
ncbi:glycerol-3-phosphate dehydrogenase [Rubidibacter lacunae KORDI 51-2]|uniref:Glycerol-3-phosphate dehydrogenase [NAD(P)+] n=1 Tax=Rubidibacter lacunae KORDI 51-2 TaxID=582515 RepID=U5DKX7_9CHRO|nr:NAD(P)H-dependent glycerol-3-phosphate dehydrogenase [Rubidibacter lacunae]ERN41214.1 glycerol-3-phosphate dehydrogenase [Rubidibacter lacunae KORDI 51-2]